MPNKTIMVVDDVESNRVLLRMMLEDDFNIVECEDGPQCLEAVAQSAPDLILLDVNMPNMTGYEVCKTIRQNQSTATLPIIFVSAMDTPEERLAGFEVGGTEYITKPIDNDLLMEKIRFSLDNLNEINEAKKKTIDAMETAMEAMTSSSELGLILEFVKSAQEIGHLRGIGEKCCEVAQGFGLNASVMIFGHHPIFVNCAPDSMEARVLERFQQSKDRIVNIGIRTLAKSDTMALLISNMPVDNGTRYGRFKDHLLVLTSICDGRLLAIQAQLSLADQRKDVLARIIKMTESQVLNLSQKLKQYDNTTKSVMLNMISELEAKLFKLGLDEDQEEQLVALAYQANEKLEQLQGELEELESELGTVLEGLYEVLNNHG